ncbi:hypothetical protein MAR_011454 [Mya arenaria]|uniref:RWD domain-containing protein n=1 Tax=Mya arenaria TaxID=6604 RepID=A0ABY7FU45_MYAAR|nr:uncharacterized protein LOC128216612 [Mya arenaria]XP_052779196.1 uncharacterized protein LOC128216612 [Mya arenaria]WAR25750.1 hypothetical protein MAR_011454 [Mya arenaria]
MASGGNKSDADSRTRDEIAAVKNKYNDIVKVISNVDDVISIKTAEVDVCCKFHLTASYPDVVPIITTESSYLTSEKTLELTSCLRNKASTLSGHRRLYILIEECKQWMDDELCEHFAHDSKHQDSSHKEKRKKAKKKSKSKQEETDMKANIQNEVDVKRECAEIRPVETIKSEADGSTKWTKGFNYFITMRIQDAALLDELETTKDWIETRYPQYQGYLMPRNRLHLTFEVLRLESESDEIKCAQAFECVKDKLTLLMRNSGDLLFEGLTHFPNFNKVIFAEVMYPSSLNQLIKAIRDVLWEAGIKIESKRFVAHLSLYRVSKTEYHSKDWPRAPLQLCKYDGVIFGSQKVDNLHVCEMGSCATDDENVSGIPFYRSIWKLEI